MQKIRGTPGVQERLEELRRVSVEYGIEEDLEEDFTWGWDWLSGMSDLQAKEK